MTKTKRDSWKKHDKIFKKILSVGGIEYRYDEIDNAQNHQCLTWFSLKSGSVVLIHGRVGGHEWVNVLFGEKHNQMGLTLQAIDDFSK